MRAGASEKYFIANDFIGKRQNTPKLCFGDEWRVEFEAAAAASLSKKTAGCRPPNTSKLCFEDRTGGLFYISRASPVQCGIPNIPPTCP